jgi:hypothetical protein
MPQVISTAAALTTGAIVGGLGTAGVAVAGPTAALIQAGVYAVAYTGIALGVSVGISALTSAQLPNPQVGQISLKSSRPLRKVAMGGPSRLTIAWECGQ